MKGQGESMGLPKKPYLRPPTDPQDAEKRANLIARASEQLAALDQYDADVDHWNRTHPNETPINTDPDGKLAEIRRYLTALLKGSTY